MVTFARFLYPKMQPMRYSFFLWMSVFLIACGDAEKNQTNASGKQMPPMKVEAYVLNPSAFQETIEVPGTIMAAEFTEIHPEIAGRIVRLNLTEGQTVAAGHLIAKIDDADLQAQLVKFQTQLEIAEQTEMRQSKLLALQGISRQDYDLSVLQVRTLKADIGILKTSIEKTLVRAPFSGKLGLKNISVGAYVTPASLITTIQQTQNLKIDFHLPEKYAQGLKPGASVSFRTTGSNTSYPARVTAMAPGLTESNRTLNYRAVVSSNDPALMPGVFTTVTIPLAEKPQALMLPAQAVIPQARGKRVIRYKNGKAEFTEVMTGTRTADQVEVISGLNAGDTIVMSGLMSIRPNATIQLGKIINATQTP